MKKINTNQLDMMLELYRLRVPPKVISKGMRITYQKVLHIQQEFRLTYEQYSPELIVLKLVTPMDSEVNNDKTAA